MLGSVVSPSLDGSVSTQGPSGGGRPEWYRPVAASTTTTTYTAVDAGPAGSWGASTATALPPRGTGSPARASPSAAPRSQRDSPSPEQAGMRQGVATAGPDPQVEELSDTGREIQARLAALDDALLALKREGGV